METALRRVWHEEKITQGDRLLFLLLLPFSLMYRLAISLRNRLFDLGVFEQKRIHSMVISVGNLTVGGTGKTPLVIMLANFLKRQGYRPAVLSRGYGGKGSSPVNIVSDGHRLLMGPVEGGDEPVLIARSAPGVAVLTGASRVVTGRAAIDQLGADILILDDGFQHRHVGRDVNILLLDRSRPFGNGLLLPAGSLREPPGALKRADLIVVTDNDDRGVLASLSDARIPSGVPLFRGIRRPIDIRQGATGQVFSLDSLKKVRVCAFSGIGSPESFRKTLELLGADVGHYIPFPDHYRYRREDLMRIQEASASASASMIVTTEKDGVHLEDFPFFLEKVFLLRIAMEIVPSGEIFEQLMLDKLNQFVKGGSYTAGGSKVS